MGVLVGSTGFVGGHLARQHGFTKHVHRSDITTIAGLDTDLLVCAGLPAEKWRANQDPSGDSDNMAALAQVLATVRAERAVLVSTIDVYQPAVGVDETTPPKFDGSGAYGAHRAWFEAFFQSNFSNTLVLRLPALYASDVRKNLVHDLLHGKADQWARVSPSSTFQFFDATQTWTTIERAWAERIALLNVTSEPVTAQAVADLFAVRLTAQTPAAEYDMRSVHADTLGGRDGYLFTAESILQDISALRGASRP